MKKLTDTQFRQGDCFLVAADDLPADAVAVDEDARVVLKHGEATGHAHAFYRQPVQLYQTPQRERYLRVVKTSALLHEEHTKIDVPPGLYKLPNQVEWTDENEPRIVAD